MRKPKTNRWSDYKSSQPSYVADVSFIRIPAKLTLYVEGESKQRFDYSFIKGRPQMASLFAKVLLSEMGRYVRRSRVATVCALRVFIQFIDRRHPDINHTALMTYELLQEFAIWLTEVQKYSEEAAGNHYSCLKRLLRPARLLYPTEFRPDFAVPNYIFPRNKYLKGNSRALGEEVLQRLVAAAERGVDEVRKKYRDGDMPEGIGPFIPFMILISLRTAINAESLYNIQRDCLEPHVIDKNAFYVTWHKLRSKKGLQRQLHYTDARGKGVLELLQFLSVYTQPLIALANKGDKDKLFLYRYRLRTKCKVAVAKRPQINNRALQEFCKRNQLPNFKISQLRPSAATHHYRETGGKLRNVQLLLGHAEMSTTQRYIGDPLVQSLHNKSIRTAQDNLLTRVTTVIPKEARQALTDLADELSSKQLKQIDEGEYDTGLCKCRNPFDSPQPGQQKGRCCTLFLACLTCPNALFFLDDLPRVIALRNHFLAEKANMRRVVWEVLYEDKIKIIDSDIIGAFSETQIAEAERLAVNMTDVPVLAARGVLK